MGETACCNCTKPVDPDAHKYDEWAVKSACDTLRRAAEIEEDKKMMGLVQEQLVKEGKALAKITSMKDLKAKAYQVGKDSEEE